MRSRPGALACFYPHPASTGGRTGLPAAVGAAALLAAITALVWAARRSRPWLLFGWAWYLIALAPVIGLVQVGMQARADRYTYVPMIGLFVAVVWEVAARTRKHAFSKRIAGGIGVLVLAAFAVLAFVQVGTWRDGGTSHQRHE